jgi:predicted membrane-bound spermidine synthase
MGAALMSDAFAQVAMAFCVFCVGAVTGWYRRWLLGAIVVATGAATAVIHALRASNAAGLSGLGDAIIFWLVAVATGVFAMGMGLALLVARLRDWGH